VRFHGDGRSGDAASEKPDASARPIGRINDRELPVDLGTLGTEELGVRLHQDLDAGTEHDHDGEPHQELLSFYGHAASFRIRPSGRFYRNRAIQP
jgi:hypothetical protein